MKTWARIIENTAIRFVLLIGSAILFAFTFWALKYRHEYPRELTTERVIGYLDNKLANIVVMVFFFCVLIAIGKIVLRGAKEQVARRIRMFAVLVTVATCIFLVIWVSICHAAPIWDQLQVFYGALEFSAGEFDLMDTYYNTYPQQYGLSFIFELLIKVSPSYHFIQYINVFLVGVIIYFVYMVTDELFHNNAVNFYVIVCTAVFVPLFLYVNFVYGELWNMAFGLMAIWFVLRYLSEKKVAYGVLGIVMMSVAMVARINVVVWAIALMLVLLVYGICHKEGTTLMLALLMIAIPILAVEGVKWTYELRSGKEILPGAPYVMTISMGLQEQWEGPGYYSGYTNSIFNGIAERDPKVATEIAMEDIKLRLNEFKSNPAYARDFFQRKIWQQWNEGTFNSLIMTCTFEEEPKGLVENVYYGNIAEGIYKWCNYYLFVMYFFSLIYVGVKFIKEHEIQKCVLIIALIGGVIFSIVWETKARYMFPYTVLVFPCMAAGINYIETGMKVICSRVLLRIRRNHK